MRTKRSHEGYLMIDHRAGEGLGAELARSVGKGTIPVPRGVFESATITCSHCQRVVILNPDRSRERGYCPGCDHYVCDQCEAARVASGVCRPFNQIADEIRSAGAKGRLVLPGKR